MDYNKIHWTPELKHRVVEIYMEHNRHARGGNVLPLDVSIELAMVELGMIPIAHDEQEIRPEGIHAVFRATLGQLHRRLLKGRSG